MGIRLFGFHIKPPKFFEKGEDAWQALWRCSLAEFFGTAIFVFLGTGSVYAANEFLNDNNANMDSKVVLVAMAHGFAITLCIYTIGDVSGGNINPAVTWALVLTRKMSFVRGFFYWCAQLGGAVVASLILRSLIPLHIYHEAQELVQSGNNTGAIGALLGCHGVNPKMEPVHAFWFEIVLTFIFVFVVFGTAISPFVGKMAPVSGGGDSYGPGKLTPLALGLTILVLHCVGIPFTGTGVNPARSFGPALVGGCWADHWVYWAGPLVGSTFAALVAHTLFLSNPDQIAQSFANIRGDRKLAATATAIRKQHKGGDDDDEHERYARVGEEVELGN